MGHNWQSDVGTRGGKSGRNAHTPRQQRNGNNGHSKKTIEEKPKDGKLLPSEVDEMVAVYEHTKRNELSENGSKHRWTEGMVNQWVEKLRKGLTDLKSSSAEALRDNFKADPNECMNTFTEIANDEHPKIKRLSNVPAKLVTGSSRFC